jgi:ornithine cyclodeaminase
MPEIKILTEAELRGCVALDGDAVACVEDCFRALATEGIAMPPILRLDIHDNNGEVDVKTAYVPGLDSFAIKISPGFFDNPKLGLPSVNGLMVLFSAKTGLVEAVLLDNGYLTDIVGAGVQARLQLEALTLVRDVAEVRVWARDPAKAGRFAEQAGDELGLPVEVGDDLGTLLAASDIVVTTTPSSEPLIRAEWLHPGLHVTAMGSDAEHKNELTPEALAAADLYVCDRQSQCAVLGELHHAIVARLVAAETTFPELGQIIAGRKAGRSDDDQITVCDLTGTGVQDTAIATLARVRAEAAGAGSTFVS